MELLEFLNPNFIILIPVLYVLGSVLKMTIFVKDKYIPLVLIVLGVGLSVGLEGFNTDSIAQGILTTGVAILGNQTIKQLKKDE